eukprot:TRINITY_DN5490_c0_g1_i3.p1 TRINITY_DN5490_c0_g1~~TRINITY_DN5490_c0_g1_i3.p1  ORF type:complete len:238 (+),score=82.17 TRINITY_DN5490_c0_g1_i3:110-823(+)
MLRSLVGSEMCIRDRFGPEAKKIPALLSKESWQAAGDADSVMVVVDAARGMCHELEFVMEELRKSELKGRLVLNKADLLRGAQRERLLVLADQIYDQSIFTNGCFMTSALKGQHVEELEEELSASAIVGQAWEFDPETLSTSSLDKTISETVREKVYRRLHQELPYSSFVQVEQVKRSEETGHVTARVKLFVNNSRQVKMVVGRDGTVIKGIRDQARRDLERILNNSVNLHISVVSG